MMVSEPGALIGKRVLIIEDDYYQSCDATKDIEQAGGTVVATTADADEACDLIKREHIDFALVDINLGYGPSFETARALRDQGIKFVFTTGYDAAIIPEDYLDVALIKKPFSQSTLMSKLAAMA